MTEPAPPRRNVEVKATDPAPQRSLAICGALGADDHGLISQRDTYFNTEHSLLKLREESPGDPHLIGYDRADVKGDRNSRYRLVPVDDAAALRDILTAVLGVRAVIVKRRRLFLWRDVRIHLDEVDGLGFFVEFEAVAAPSSDLSREYRLIARLRHEFHIGDDRLCATGYIGLLRTRGMGAARPPQKTPGC